MGKSARTLTDTGREHFLNDLFMDPSTKSMGVCKLSHYDSYISERGSCCLERLRKQSRQLWLRMRDLEFGPMLWHNPRNMVSIIEHCPVNATCLQGLNEIMCVEEICKLKSTLQIHGITK